MDGTKPTGDISARARDALAQAETGNSDAVAQLETAHDSSPTEVEAVEQEASEGPAGRGLAR